MLSEAAQQGPLAVDVATGATVVLRQRDLEALAHDQRLEGIGLAMFDMIGITDGPLRDWYGRLMFSTEGDYHRRIRSLVSRAFTPRSVEALRASAARHGRLCRRFSAPGRRPCRGILDCRYPADVPPARRTGQRHSGVRGLA